MFRESDCRRGPDGSYTAEVRSYDVQSARINVDMLYFPQDGKPKRRWHSIRLYTYQELTKMLEAAGLKVTGTWGAFDGQDLGRLSPRMLVRAQKA
jgi:hypothetical protein